MKKFRGPEIKLSKKEKREMDQKQGTTTPIMGMEEAGKKIDALVRQYRFDHPQVSYQMALERILEMYPDLKTAYVQTGVSLPGAKHYTIPHNSIYIDPKDDPMESARAVRMEVHQRVMEYMEDNGAGDYEQAMAEVFEDDPELKERYAKS